MSLYLLNKTSIAEFQNFVAVASTMNISDVATTLELKLQYVLAFEETDKQMTKFLHIIFKNTT